MSASYDPNLTSDLDWVRFLTGDRDPAAARVQDEEIAAVLAEEANKYLAAARIGEMFQARGGVTAKAVDDLRIQWSDDPEGAYGRYLKTLRARGCDLLIPRSKGRIFGVL